MHTPIADVDETLKRPNIAELRAKMIEEMESRNRNTEQPSETLDRSAPSLAEELADPPADATTDPADEPPAQPTPGEPYQTKEGWQVDIIEPYKQTFKAKTLKELIAKMATAQMNATKKIGELKKSRPSAQPEAAAPEPDYKPTALSAEEQFLLSQELQTNPTGAVAKLFKATVGASPDEIREALIIARKVASQEKAAEATRGFLEDHPAYVDSQANMKAMNDYLSKNSLAVTRANLNLAYDDLLEANLLETESQPSTPPKDPASAIVRQPQQQRRASVGISPRSVSSIPDEEGPADKKPNALTVEELRKLPRDQRRRIAEQQIQREQRVQR